MAMTFFRNGYLLWISVAVILVAGISALNGLPRLEDPRITNRNPLIIANYPGASPERVETLLTEKLEQSLQEVPEIKKLESSSRAGVATIAVELVDQTKRGENEAVFSKIRDKVSDVPLPDGALPVIVDEQRGATAFTLIMALTWDFDSEPQLGVLKRHAEEFADRLRTIAGTEIVRIYGDPDEEITVTVDSNRLADLGLASSDVSAAIAAADAKQPAGQLRGRQADLSVEVTGALSSISRIQNIPLREGESGSVVRVVDVAQVRRQWKEPPDEIALADGARAVFVAARCNSDQRVDRWNDEAEQIVVEYRKRLGSGVLLQTMFNQSFYTNQRLRGLTINLLAGAAVIVAVIFVFMGWRSSLLVGSALPLVSGATLFLIFLCGGSLHQMSIFGIIVALGLLIDNAIVVVDEIQKAKKRGFSPEEAVQDRTSHLFGPLLASTLTTVFAFAPIVLLPGNIGDFVGSIGGSVILAIVSSFLIALTLIAAMAGRYGSRVTPSEQETWLGALLRRGVRSDPLKLWYRRTLRLALHHPFLAILFAVTPSMLGFLLFTQLGSQFFPRVDRNMFQLRIWLAPESSITNTRSVAERIEEAIRDRDEIDKIDWLIGSSAPSVYYNLLMNADGSAYYGQAIITTKSKDTVKRLIRELQRDLDNQFPEAQIVVTQFGQGPPIAAPVQYRIYGPSVRRLQDLGEQIRLALQQHPDVLHTRVTMPRGKPKLWIETDENAARLAGLSLSDVSRQLQGNLEGTVGGSILEGIEEMPVRVRLPQSGREDVGAIESTTLVSTNRDSWIPLSAIGRARLRPEIGEIGRKNGVRCNTIRGYVTNEALPIDVTNRVLRQLDDEGFQLPPGYRLEIGGDSEEEAGAIGNLKTYVPVLVTLTVATLILVFRSVALSIVLASVAVLSIGPGLLSTWLFGFPVSFNTILGSLGLIGVALNDNIVVLAAIRANPLARTGDREAIVEEIVDSTRHILSTTLTTAGGFLPLILAGGDFWPPLAVVIAGGVIGATLIALVYIPATYVLLKRVQEHCQSTHDARRTAANA